MPRVTWHVTCYCVVKQHNVSEIARFMSWLEKTKKTPLGLAYIIGTRVLKSLNSYLIHAQTSSPNRESGTPITLKTQKNKTEQTYNTSLCRSVGFSSATKSLVN